MCSIGEIIRSCRGWAQVTSRLALMCLVRVKIKSDWFKNSIKHPCCQRLICSRLKKHAFRKFSTRYNLKTSQHTSMPCLLPSRRPYQRLNVCPSERIPKSNEQVQIKSLVIVFTRRGKCFTRETHCSNLIKLLVTHTSHSRPSSSVCWQWDLITEMCVDFIFLMCERFWEVFFVLGSCTHT